MAAAIAEVWRATSIVMVILLSGLQVLMEHREKQERSKMREKFWELAGSKIGAVSERSSRD